jgi:hypothetical protein
MGVVTLVFASAVSIFAMTDEGSFPTEVWLVAVAFYVVFALSILRARIVVSNDAIQYRPTFGATQRLRFAEIGRSTPRVLTEPDHPVNLDIYVSGRPSPAIVVGLKPFRQRDVDWLLALPGLHVRS